MPIAVIHHHLCPGGVTRVVENHLLALDAVATGPERVAVLHGGRSDGWRPERTADLRNIEVTLHPVPLLDHDDRISAGAAPLSEAIRSALADLRFAPAETVLHVHNHSLGRNTALPPVLAGLARDGWRLLLQVHDFAEDSRPGDFRRIATAFGERSADLLYPQAGHVHYATLTRRDHAALSAAGIPDDRSHLLSNPVSDRPCLPERDSSRRAVGLACGIPSDRRFVLYPVRGIRRKNLGELLLLSVLDEDAVYGLAVGPADADQKPYHDRWRAFATELGLPVRFGVCEPSTTGLTFPQALAAADACVTTSVAEGFGMAFLETCVAGKPLFGRDIPDVTADFKAAGVRFDDLYGRLSVPLDLVGEFDFADAFRSAAEAQFAAFGRPLPHVSDWTDAFLAKTAGGVVDFGDLDEALQEAVIRRVRDDPAVRDELRTLNPTATGRTVAVDPTANAAAVLAAFGLEPSGRRLRAAYDAVLASPVTPVVGPEDGGAILRRFLDLRTFRMIRGV